MKRIVSGITPSGDGTLHIGNYLGAVKQFKALAETNECFLFVADLHALTTVQKKEQLQKNIEALIVNELALLGDLKNIVFFRQSDVPEHTELQTILNNYTSLGLIKRAHAYKDKLEKEVGEEDVNMGLFNYPVLMASDILIYKADLVPVGKDQKQHIEITRDIGDRFNKTYKKKVLKLPDGFIPEEVAVIYGTDGKRKMSKSLGNIISIFESEEIIKKQVMSTYTDPSRVHANDPGHIEGNMVFTYLDYFGDRDKVAQFKEAYTRGTVADVEVKEYLFDSLMTYFKDARSRYQALKDNPDAVKKILADGAVKARSIAQKTLQEVRETIGLKNAYSVKKMDAVGKSDIFTIDDFMKMDVRVGYVDKAEHVEISEKLIRLHVDFSGDKRIIFTGVRQYGYTADDFQGKQFLFVVNLPPRKMVGEESQGMILAVGDEKPMFVSGEGLPVGSRVR